MKNITLRIDEQVLAAVRRHAAAQETSVNRLVRDFLASIAEHEARGKQVRQRLRELSDHSPARIGSRSWSRDELHDR